MGLDFDLPATYEIRIKDHLDYSWSDRLGGMAIEVIDLPYPQSSSLTPKGILMTWRTNLR